MRSRTTADFLLELKGYRLTTIEIVYFLPDHPDLLQIFIWQTLDLAPNFPRLQTFLAFWRNNIEGQILSVQVVQSSSYQRDPMRLVKGEFHLPKKT